MQCPKNCPVFDAAQRNQLKALAKLGLAKKLSPRAYAITDAGIQQAAVEGIVKLDDIEEAEDELLDEEE